MVIYHNLLIDQKINIERIGRLMDINIGMIETAPLEEISRCRELTHDYGDNSYLEDQ